MECNKDEAVRAKAIADMKLVEQDYSRAKKFVQKAQSLYPQLDGLSQLMATVDVYMSAGANKKGGEAEVDWYEVLGISHTADDDTVKRQYRKLALILHPDKNKSPGADGAFKLIGQAWSLLSDRSKRLAYNQRRCRQGTRFSQNVPMPTSSNRRSSAPTQSDTYWTICNKCKTHYELLKIYLNHTFSCTQCGNAFVASEASPPSNYSSPSNSQTSVSVPSASYHRSDTYWSICKNCKKQYELLNIYLNHTFSCTKCGKPFVASKAPLYNYSSPSNSSNHVPGGNTLLAGICVGFCTLLLSTFIMKKL